MLRARKVGQFFRNRNTDDHPALYRALVAATAFISSKEDARRYSIEWLVPRRCHRCGTTGQTVYPYWVRDEPERRVDLACLTCRTAAARYR